MNTKLNRSALLALSIQLAFGCGNALANPTGAQVASGSVGFAQPNASTLAITNSPGAIINWQNFSISAGETTQFIQQSASSTVLNRVVGQNLSQIYGTLQSNGRVFLINPNGIIFGASAVVDTAGFVTSTLNLSDAEFLANRLRFLAGPEAGPISNHGLIRVRGDGSVVLIAPNIENTGIIQTDAGQLILAAGRRISLASMDGAGVEFEVQAPDDAVLNLGKLIAERGTVQVFAGQLKHSGEIRAGALTRDADGDIVLAARDSLTVAAGSTTRADGASGGRILLQAADGRVDVAGNVSARGSSGGGGDIRVLGNEVSLSGDAKLDASGATGGGVVLVGGDFQGSNAAVQNARNTFVGSHAGIRADGGDSGDGGKVVVWSDDTTYYYGSISARGGASAGNGGDVEVSGKINLAYRGAVDVGALNGAVGRLLLDPLILYVRTGGGALLGAVDQASDVPGTVASIDPAALAAANASVTLAASGDMHFEDPVALTAAGAGLTATAGASLNVNANITTNNGGITLTSGTGTLFLSFGTQLNSGGGAIALNSTASSLSASSSTQINSGGGLISVTAPVGTVSLSNTLFNTGGGNFTVASANGSFVGGITTLGGNVTANSTGGSVQFQNDVITSGGGIQATAGGSGQIFLSFGVDLLSSGGAISLGTANGFISASSLTTIDSGGNNIALTSATSGISLGSTSLAAGAGAVTASGNSSVSLGNVTGGSLTASSTNSSLSAANVTVGGSINFSARNGLSFGNLTGSGVSATSTLSFVSGGDINLGAGNASLTGQTGVFTNTITTTGNVVANAPAGDVSLDVTNATSASFTAGGNVFSTLTGVGVVTAISTATSFGQIFLSAPGNLIFDNVSAAGPNSAVELNAGGSIIGTGARTVVGTEVALDAAGALGSAALPINTTATNLFLNAGTTFNVANSTALQTLELDASAINMGPSSAVTATGLTLTLSTNNVDATLTNFSNATAMSGGFELNVVDGGLNITSATLPASSAGGMRFSAAGDLNAIQVTDGGFGGVQLSAFGGNMTLGNGASGVSSTAGAIVVDALGNIVLNSATGTAIQGGAASVVSQTGSITAGQNNVAFEVNGTTGGVTLDAVSIGDNVTPFHINGASVSLTTRGGALGGPAANVVAQTTSLSIIASNTFNVNTGTTNLSLLGLTASPSGMGATTGSVVSNGTTYLFLSDGTNITDFNTGSPNVFAPPAAQLGNTFAFDTSDGNMVGGTINTVASNGRVILNAHAGDVAVNNINTGTNTLSIDAGFGGSITTGTIDSSFVSLGQFNPVANITTLDITSSGSIHLQTGFGAGTITTGVLSTANGSVDIFASESGGNVSLSDVNLGTGQLRINQFPFFATIGNVSVADITAGQISINTGDNTTYGAVSLGALAANNIFVNTGSFSSHGNVSTANITASQAQINTGFGSTFGTLTTGPIIMQNVSGFFELGAGSGLYQFTQINAGTGSVTIKSAGGIEHTGGPGINSTTVVLESSGGPISATSAAPLLMTGTKNLTVDGAGFINLQNNDDFATLNITVRDNAGGFNLTGMPNQTVTVTPAASGVNVLATNGPSAPAGFSFIFANLDAAVGQGDIVNIDVDTKGGAPSGGLVSLRAQEKLGAPANFSVATGGSSVTLFAGTGIDIGSLAGVGGTTLSTNAGQVSFNTITTTVGSITVDTPNAIVFNNATSGSGLVDMGAGFGISFGNIAATTGVTLDGGTVGITGTGTVASTSGSVNMFATSSLGATINLAGALTTNGSVLLDTGGGLVYNTVNAGGGFITLRGRTGGVTGGSLTSTGSGMNVSTNTSGGGAITLSGPVSGASSLTFTAGSNIAFTTMATTAGTINVTSQSGTVTGSSVTGPSTVTLRAPTGAVGTSATPIALSGAATRSLTLEAGGLFFVTDTANLAALTLTTPGTGAAGSFVLTAPNLTGFGLSRDGAGTLLLTGASGTPANPLSSFSLTSNSGHLNMRGNIVNVGSVTLDAGQFSASGGDLLITTASPTTIQGTGSILLRARRHVILQGGAGAGDSVTVRSTGSSVTMNTAFGGDVRLLAGSGTNAAVLVAAASSLSVNSGNDVLLVAGPAAGASATLQHVGPSGSQSISASHDVTLIGGTGSGSGNANAEIINGVGSQFVSASNLISLTGGTDFSNVRIANSGTTQSLTGFGGIHLATVAGPNTGSIVAVETTGTGSQSINSSGGSVLVTNSHSPGNVQIGANLVQSVSARFVGVATMPGTFSTSLAAITAGGNQTFSLFGPIDGHIMAIGALGLGTAKIESGATQTITAGDFFLPSTVLVGDATASGKSLLKGANQNFVIGALTVLGGAGADASAKVAATGSQTISTLAGGVAVIGGSGANATAAIDPTTQSIFALTEVLVEGGGGNQASASITSTSTTDIAATSVANVRGAGDGADAFIATNTLNIVAVTCESCDALSSDPVTNPDRDRGPFATTLNISALSVPPRPDSLEALDSPLDPTAIILALTERSEQVVEDSGPSEEGEKSKGEDDKDKDKKKRRAGQCR